MNINKIPESLLYLAELAGANPGEFRRGFNPNHSISLMEEIKGSAAYLRRLSLSANDIYRSLVDWQRTSLNATKEVRLPSGIKGTLPRFPDEPREPTLIAIMHLLHSLAHAASSPLVRMGGREMRRECIALPLSPNAYGRGNDFPNLSYRAIKGIILALGSYHAPNGDGPWLTAVRGHDFGEGRLTRIAASEGFKTWMLHQGLVFPMHPHGRKKRRSRANISLLWRSTSDRPDGSRVAKLQYPIDRPLQGDEMILPVINCRLAHAAEYQLPDYETYEKYWNFREGYSDLPHGSGKMFRVFSEFDGNGGRIFGHWVQQMPSALRAAYLFINGKPTVELDFGAMQLMLLYATAGVDIPEGDLYDPQGRGSVYREAMKDVLSVSIGNATRAATVSALSKKWKTECRSLASKAAIVYDEFWGRHRAVCPHDGRGNAAWGQLQYAESNIALRVLRYLLEQGILAIPIHDSFIVQARYEDRLREAMRMAVNDFFPGARINIRNASMWPPRPVIN